MKIAIHAAVAVTLALASTPALAAEPTAPAAPTPVAHKDAVAAPDPAAQEKPEGLTFGVGFALAAPVGKVVDAPGASMQDFVGTSKRVELRLGYYPTQHFGVVAGFGFGVAAGFHCDSQSSMDCGAFSLQVPLVAQYAFADRRHGFYLEAGLELVNSYSVYDPTGSMWFSNGLSEGRFAVGYRLPIEALDRAERSALAFTLFAEGGEFSDAKVHAGSANSSGPIDQKAFHAVFGAGISYAFAP